MNNINKTFSLGIIVIVLTLLLSMGLVNAVSQEELNEAKALIDSKITCDKLTNEQLEIIGEYYMEQMMPGEAHKRAHEMMGLEEGSEAEEQFHINLARRSYCGENVGGMMGGGMMGNYPNYYSSSYNSFSLTSTLLNILLILLIIVVIIWLVKLLTKKGGRK